MSVPIWKDTFGVVTNTDSVEYRILKDGNVIYTGKAFKKPGASRIEIKFNDVCADNMSVVSPNFLYDGFQFDDLSTFLMQKKSGTSWVDVSSNVFKNDWSYDNSAGETLSAPITNRFDTRQFLCKSFRGKYKVNGTINVRGGGTRSATYGLDITSTSSSGFIIAIGFTGTKYVNMASLVVDGYTYYVSDSCAKYAIHYKNAYGGWDSLLLEGNCTEEESSNRKEAGIEYDNSFTSVFKGKVCYLNDVSKTYTLRTGWLTDAESKLMHHLLNTTDAILQDLETGTLIPVILGDQTNPVKTFKNQGCQMVSYEFTASSARDYTRK